MKLDPDNETKDSSIKNIYSTVAWKPKETCEDEGKIMKG